MDSAGYATSNGVQLVSDAVSDDDCLVFLRIGHCMGLIPYHATNRMILTFYVVRSLRSENGLFHESEDIYIDKNKRDETLDEKMAQRTTGILSIDSREIFSFWQSVISRGRQTRITPTSHTQIPHTVSQQR